MRILSFFILTITIYSFESLGATSSSQWGTTKRSYGATTASARRPTQIIPFGPGSHNVAVDFGQVFLIGVGKDLQGPTGSTSAGDPLKYDNSIGFRLHYTHGVSEVFGFDASLGFSSHEEGNYSLWTFLPGLRMNLAWFDKIVPHIVFGLGFFKPTYRCYVHPTTQRCMSRPTVAATSGTYDDDFNSGKGTKTKGNSTPQQEASNVPGYNDVSDILFGLHVGPGVDLQISEQFFFGARVTFHHMFESKKLVSIAADQSYEIGGTLATFFLHTGVTF